jgi:hypothetical protein
MPNDLSVSDLREIIVSALLANGWTEEEIAGYVRAHETSGWLRPKCPAWIRNSAGVFYALPPAGGFGEKSPPKIELKSRQNAVSRPPGANAAPDPA